MSNSVRYLGEYQSPSNNTVGTYSKRKGTIITTKQGSVAQVTGHFAIVYSRNYIVESLSDGMVLLR